MSNSSQNRGDLLRGFFSFIQGKKDQNAQKFSETLRSVLGDDSLAELQELISDESSRPPKVAVIGKAGVGKTTTINSLFNAEWKTSHTIRGTTAAQRKEFTLEGGGVLSVVDLPGLGEDIESDEEYSILYKEELPAVDIVLYVIQADGRDLAEDQRILSQVVLPAMGNLSDRLVIGLNKVDLIGPGIWNTNLNYPSREQEVSINRRCNDISTKLSSYLHTPTWKIVPYSAELRYQLSQLLQAIIRSAGELGWKFAADPKDPWQLASPEVQEIVKNEKAKRRGKNLL